jgi:hypothetical protein
MRSNEMFTKHHYIEVAEIIRDEPTPEKLATKFAEMFKADNPLFNTAIFREACGLRDDND